MIPHSFETTSKPSITACRTGTAVPRTWFGKIDSVTLSTPSDMINGHRCLCYFTYTFQFFIEGEHSSFRSWMTVSKPSATKCTGLTLRWSCRCGWEVARRRVWFLWLNETKIFVCCVMCISCWRPITCHVPSTSTTTVKIWLGWIWKGCCQMVRRLHFSPKYPKQRELTCLKFSKKREKRSLNKPKRSQTFERDE